MNLYQKLSKIIFNVIKNLAIERRPDSRAIGAEIENIIKNNWSEIIRQLGGEKPEFYLDRVRTIYDMSFKYKNQSYGIDIKSVDINRGFTSGGVCAVKNLLDFMVNRKWIFLVCEVGYSTQDKKIKIEYVKVAPFHFIPISNLHIENLGTGQIQFKESLQKLVIKPVKLEKFYKQFSALSLSLYGKVQITAKKRFGAIKDFVASRYKIFRMR